MPVNTAGQATSETFEAAAPTRPTVAIHTHGCKLNQADSQALGRRFRDAGYSLVDLSSNPDIIVLNSCTVTGTADAKARQFLRAAKRRNPDSMIVATGCYAERAPGDLEKLEAVSLVLGNTEKSELVASVRKVLEKEPSSSPVLSLENSPSHETPRLDRGRPDAGRPYREEATARAGRTRAMVKIQEGCDQVCAYCIVPRVRGRERSIPAEEIVAEINRHTDEGCREVSLTGTQLGTYGFDIPGLDLAGLLGCILSETRVERLRVSSLQAHEITEQLLDLWSDTRLMRHFHIPLQSGSDRILRRMRRRYVTEQFRAALDMVRDKYPDAGVTTDFIVGFPGETTRTSVAAGTLPPICASPTFTYSPTRRGRGRRPFTLESRSRSLEKRERMAEMLALSAECRLQFRESQLGKVRPVLWEQSSRSGLDRVDRQLRQGQDRERFRPRQPDHRRETGRNGGRLGAGRGRLDRRDPAAPGTNLGTEDRSRLVRAGRGGSHSRIQTAEPLRSPTARRPAGNPSRPGAPGIRTGFHGPWEKTSSHPSRSARNSSSFFCSRVTSGELSKAEIATRFRWCGVGTISPRKTTLSPPWLNMTIWCPLAWPSVTITFRPGRISLSPSSNSKLPPVIDGEEIVSPVRVVGPFVGIAGLVPALLLYVVLGPGKRRHHIPGSVQPGAAARMVKMEMCENDRVDVLGRQADRFQAPEQPAGHQAQALLVGVQVLGPDPCVDQYVVASGMQQQAVQTQGHAVLAVGYNAAFPSDLRDGTEHGPAVDFHYSITDYFHVR